MTRIREIKTTFTAGEVSDELLGRGDLRAYENGALALRNVFINPTGGAGPDQFAQPLASQYEAITVVSNGAQWYIISKF